MIDVVDLGGGGGDPSMNFVNIEDIFRNCDDALNVSCNWLCIMHVPVCVYTCACMCVLECVGVCR